MNVEQATKWFLELPGKWQDRFIALLINRLTVAARETYEPQTEAVVAPTRLRHYNEMIHRSAGFLDDVLDREGGRYLGEFWLAPMFFEQTEDKELDAGLRWAFNDAAEWVEHQVHGPQSIKFNDRQPPKRIGA